MERPVVVKIGGSTLGHEDTSLQDVVSLHKEGVPVVVVHGGGKTISQWMEKQGIRPTFVRGLRVTDTETMQVVTAVLTGLVNKQLVATLTGLGGRAVGISGADGNLLEAQVANPELGLVGKVVQVNPEPIFQVIEAGFIPVVAPVGIHLNDGSRLSCSLMNINGDTAAGDIARALRASLLVFLTDVEGVMDAEGRVIPRLRARHARLLIDSGIARGGMIPKLESALTALETVEEVDIVDGRRPRALLECVRGAPRGTRITP